MSRAVAVPRWVRVRKGRKIGSDCRKLQRSRLGTMTEWPSDETGKSSVAPWRRPRKSACHQDTPYMMAEPGGRGLGHEGVAVASRDSLPHRGGGRPQRLRERASPYLRIGLPLAVTFLSCASA